MNKKINPPSNTFKTSKVISSLLALLLFSFFGLGLLVRNVTSEQSANVGIHFSSPLASVNYLIERVKNEILGNVLKKLSFENEKGSSTGLDYELSHIRVSQLRFGVPHVEISSIDILQVQFSDIGGRVDMKWSISRSLLFFTFRDGGDAHVNFNGRVTFKIKLSIEPNSNYHLRFKIQSIHVDFDQFRINITGSWLSFLYNIILRFTENNIKKMLKREIEKWLPSEITRYWNNKAQSIRRFLSLNVIPAQDHKPELYLMLDVTPLSIFLNETSSLITFSVLGETIIVQNTQFPSGKSPPNPVGDMESVEFQCHGRNSQIMVSEETLGGWISSLYDANAFHKIITDENIPSRHTIRLTSNELKKYLPSMTDMEFMRISIQFLSTPRVLLQKDSYEMIGHVLVVLEGGNKVESIVNFKELFSLSVLSRIQFQEIAIKKQFLTFSAKLKSYTATLLNSNAGHVRDMLIHNIAEMALFNALIPLIESYTHQGLPLSVHESFILSDTSNEKDSIFLQKGMMTICTEFNYTP